MERRGDEIRGEERQCIAKEFWSPPRQRWRVWADARSQTN